MARALQWRVKALRRQIRSRYIRGESGRPILQGARTAGYISEIGSSAVNALGPTAGLAERNINCDALTRR